jgi:hypothetical protein
MPVRRIGRGLVGSFLLLRQRQSLGCISGIRIPKLLTHQFGWETRSGIRSFGKRNRKSFLCGF